MHRPAADVICQKVVRPVLQSGRLHKQDWDEAQPSARFVDIVTGEPGLYDTRVVSRWDDEALYIRFDAEEPLVEARLRKRGALVFTENAVEIMIDGGDCYYELAVNALGTVYEVFHIWKDAYRRGGRFDVPEFDLLERNVMTFGGDYDRDPQCFWRGKHERGCRWSFLDWAMPGLRVYVDVDGVLNDPTHIDQGWVTEIAIPWRGMDWLAGHRDAPPRADDQWNIFFARIQRLTVGGEVVEPRPIWALRPHGHRDPHRPESFPEVLFTNPPSPLDGSVASRRAGDVL